jgi:hypothetical protein
MRHPITTAPSPSLRPHTPAASLQRRRAARPAHVIGLVLATVAACGDNAGALVDGAPADAIPATDAATDGGRATGALSSQGLYADVARKTVVDAALEYAPLYPLWSDGAEKRRWLLLPDGATIDTSDLDHWRFPAGTRLFKEFRDEATGRRLETRLLRVDGPGQVFMVSYVWNDDESDAFEAPAGADDVRGTDHDVPTQARCRTCHQGEPDSVLGFTAIQLSGTAAPNLTTIAPLLSRPPESTASFVAPGAAVESAALGYLHANCGVCHNPAGSAARDTCLVGADGVRTRCLVLRLSVTEAGPGKDPRATEAWRSTVDEPTHGNYQGGFPRVQPGEPDRSALVVRAGQRGSGAQMPPPFASSRVDAQGVALLTAWVAGMSSP